MSDPREALARLGRVQNPYEKLKETTAILRGPDGCEWDRAQDLHSMKEGLLEEASEVIAAIENADPENLKEELGDLGFLVFFFCRLAEEKGWFTADDAYAGVVEKLIFRHPHVFGDLQAENQAEILRNWEKLKEAEQRKKGEQPQFGEKTAHLPGLLRADKIQRKAARRGFDWKKQDYASLFAVLRSEIDELEEAVSKRSDLDERGDADFRSSGDSSETDEARLAIEGELGDLLFSVVNLARHLDVSSEVALHGSTEKFIRRFRRLEELALAESSNPFEWGPDRADSGERLNALEALYLRVKGEERERRASQHVP